VLLMDVAVKYQLWHVGSCLIAYAIMIRNC
jgi:hypothetical protein